MASKPITSETIAMTEKKMDMTLDDIIKMSKPATNTSKKQRVSNRNQQFVNNAAQNKSAKLRQFMDTRSSLRQGALAQRRTNFQGNHFPLAAETARKAAVVPIVGRNFGQRHVATNKPRLFVAPIQRKVSNGGSSKGGSMKQQQRQQEKFVTKQRPQTLDSRFANMKEQRMKTLSKQNNGGRRNGVGQPKPRPPWGRFNN